MLENITTRRINNSCVTQLKVAKTYFPILFLEIIFYLPRQRTTSYYCADAKNSAPNGFNF
jgi:hypothetical protein